LTKDTERRKRDHLILAQDRSLNFTISAGFDRWRFIHNALPELDLDDIDTSTQFLGRRLSFPLLISSMSGGTSESLGLNSTLAIAAEAVGCALGLGSIRAAIEDPTLRDSFLIARDQAPSAVILANIGISQIQNPNMLTSVAAFCDDLKANALIIHLNSLQEAFQPEGQTNLKDSLSAIWTWVQEFPLPIIVKEVGQGLSIEAVSRLEAVGVKTIDLAGAGGSNWINIERQRLGDDNSVLKSAAQYFENWGEPTAEVLAELDSKALIIASGGVSDPMDMAKALALGAGMTGVAGPFLKAGLSGNPELLINKLMVWQKALELIMFGCGVQNISSLVGNKALLKMAQQRKI